MNPDRSEIEKKVIEAIKSVTFKTVSTTDQLTQEGLIDSITVVDLSVLLEEEFSIKVPFVDLNEQHFGNVESIVNYVLIKLN